MRTFPPSSKRRNPMRVGRLHLLHSSITFDIGIDASRSIMPACRTAPVALTCLLIKLIPSTSSRSSLGKAERTLPFLPLSLPVITSTVSFFLIFIAHQTHKTSGASDIILVKFLSLSSLATGPKMRVPLGLFLSVRIAAALSSNLI